MVMRRHLSLFSVEKNRNKVELTVHAANTLVPRQREHVGYVCFDRRCRRYHRGQIRKNKTRLARRLRQDALFVLPARRRFPFVPEDPEEEFEIVRRKTFPMKPMTQEEAILQMNLLEHSFFAFKDEDNGDPLPWCTGGMTAAMV